MPRLLMPLILDRRFSEPGQRLPTMFGVGVAMLVAMCLLAMCHASSASAALSWQDGTAQLYSSRDCTTGSVDAASVGYAGVYYDTGNPPKVGDIYYVRALIYGGTVATINGLCYGFQPTEIQIMPPPNSSLAISSSNPVRCYRTLPGGDPTTLSDCPSTGAPPVGVSGYYKFDPTDGGSAGQWHVPYGGGSIEVQVPVKSTAAMTGYTSGGYCYYCVAARYDVQDGYTNIPYVAAAAVKVAAATPPISSPASSNLTRSGAKTSATVNNQNQSGTTYFDLGTSSGNYTQHVTAGTAPTSTTSTTASATWSSLNSGTTYHWRARFVATGGQIYTTPDQTFSTGTAGATGTTGTTGSGGSTGPVTGTAKVKKVTVKGPHKVKKGKKATYKVKVKNSGTATATGVKLKVAGKGVKSGKSIGNISAGRAGTVKVRLKFKKSGKIVTRFKVRSGNGRGKTATKLITVRK